MDTTSHPTSGEAGVMAEGGLTIAGLGKSIQQGEPWMEDGSIVLKAQSTYFRVHRSVLARNAAVFADMFQMPQPIEAGDDQVMVDGCLVLELADDPKELGHFLRALYDGQKYFPADVGLPFEVIVALIRLGTKYEAIHLRDVGISRLPGFIPRHLHSCDESSQSRLEVYHRRCAVALANLAVTHSVDEALPHALYACCQVPEDHLQNGIPYEDDEEKVSEALLPMNIDRVRLGRERLTALTETIKNDMANTLGKTNACKQTRVPDRNQCWASMPTSIATWNPIRWLEVWYEGVEEAWLCSPMCLMNARTFRDKKLKEVRQRLPGLFDLPKVAGKDTVMRAQSATCTCHSRI